MKWQKSVACAGAVASKNWARNNFGLYHLSFPKLRRSLSLMNKNEELAEMIELDWADGDVNSAMFANKLDSGR